MFGFITFDGLSVSMCILDFGEMKNAQKSAINNAQIEFQKWMSQRKLNKTSTDKRDLDTELDQAHPPILRVKDMSVGRASVFFRLPQRVCVSTTFSHLMYNNNICF